jgi:cyclase
LKKRGLGMKKRTYLSGVAALHACLCVTNAQGQPPPAELDLIEVHDDLYVIHNEAVPGNATALITNEGVLLIDDKFERDYGNMVTLLRSVTDQPVRFVINTHYHGDHSGSNARFQAAGAEIVASEQARLKMVEFDQSGLPVFTIEDFGRIHIGGKVVELYHFGRAHTDGDVVVYFRDYRLLVAGDLFTLGDATPQLIDYAGGGSAKDWTRTLDEVMQLGFDTVIPGHGLVTTRAEMQRFRDSTLVLRNRVQEMVRGGSSREEIEVVLREEFGWHDLHISRGLDGLIGELR